MAFFGPNNRAEFRDSSGSSLLDRIGGKLQSSDDGGANWGAVGQLTEYYQYLSAPNQALTVGAGTIANPYLNGDVDGDYLIDGDIFVAASGTISFLLNGSSTNLRCGSSDGTIGAAMRTDWTISRAGTGGSPLTFSNGDTIFIQGRLRARSGHVRRAEISSYVTRSGSDTFFLLSGKYDDITTNVTSFGALHSAANGVGAGSYLRLTRLQTTNPLSLTPGTPQVVYASVVDNVISP